MDDRIYRAILKAINDKEAAEMISAALNDPELNTESMFGKIGIAYLYGNEDFRKGMSAMFEILTESTLEAFVELVGDMCLKPGEGDET